MLLKLNCIFFDIKYIYENAFYCIELKSQNYENVMQYLKCLFNEKQFIL